MDGFGQGIVVVGAKQLVVADFGLWAVVVGAKHLVVAKFGQRAVEGAADYHLVAKMLVVVVVAAVGHFRYAVGH